jgi:transcription initiation factor TFIIE subunit alpha
MISPARCSSPRSRFARRCTTSRKQRIVRRAHVKEKDTERIDRTRARAEENGVEEAIILERLRAIEKKIVTYVCLDYSRIVDAVQLRLATAHADLKYRVEKGPVSVLYKCTNDPDICGKRYSSLDAMRLLDPTTGQFTCQVCRGEVVQLGGGEDGAPPEPRTKEGLKAILGKFELQTAPVVKQLAKVKGLTPPQYGTLNEWTRAKAPGFGTRERRATGSAAPADTARCPSTSITSRRPRSR